MHRKARRLVHHYDILVLVKHRKTSRKGFQSFRNLSLRFKQYLHKITGLQKHIYLPALTIDTDPSQAKLCAADFIFCQMHPSPQKMLQPDPCILFFCYTAYLLLQMLTPIPYLPVFMALKQILLDIYFFHTVRPNRPYRKFLCIVLKIFFKSTSQKAQV